MIFRKDIWQCQRDKERELEKLTVEREDALHALRLLDARIETLRQELALD